mmetsp:Transcript_3165/g.9490  ORF Transcript_3165/g.9490 Transcript_3165/m.9490 type:complete len:340 (-) Transcript_3165:84-1103(-)
MAPSATVVACLLVLAQAERNSYGCQPDKILFKGKFSLRSIMWWHREEGDREEGDVLQEWLAEHRGTRQMVHLKFVVERSALGCQVLNLPTKDKDQKKQVMKLKKSFQVLQDVRQACETDSARCPYAVHFPRILLHSGLGPTAGSRDPVFLATEAPTGGAAELAEWLQGGRSPNEIEDVVQQLFKALALLHSLNWVHGGLLDPESVWIAEGPVLWLTNLACHQKFRGRDSQLDLSCAPAQLRPPRPPQPEPNLRKQFFGYDLWCAGELLKWMLENNKGTTGMFSFFRKVRQTKVRDIKAIASGLLQHQPSNRTTAAEVLEKHFNIELPRSMKQPMQKVAQ